MFFFNNAAQKAYTTVAQKGSVLMEDPMQVAQKATAPFVVGAMSYCVTQYKLNRMTQVDLNNLQLLVSATSGAATAYLVCQTNVNTLENSAEAMKVLACALVAGGVAFNYFKEVTATFVGTFFGVATHGLLGGSVLGAQQATSPHVGGTSDHHGPHVERNGPHTPRM